MALTLDLTPNQESTLAALAATQGISMEQAAIRAFEEVSERRATAVSTGGYRDLFSDPLEGRG